MGVEDIVGSTNSEAREKCFTILIALVEREGMYGDQVGLQRIKGGEIIPATRVFVCTASVDAGIDCLTRASLASAWEWDGGSRPFFWRWGREYWKEARDGAKVWIGANLPSCKEKQ